MSDGRPAPGSPLCRLDELADPGGRGFAFPVAAGEDARPFLGFVVRRGETLQGFVDSCPHVGAPLASVDGRYLTPRGDYVVCFNHGALFRPDDGVCVAGPCVKRALRPWAVEVRDGMVVVA